MKYEIKWKVSSSRRLSYFHGKQEMILLCLYEIITMKNEYIDVLLPVQTICSR